MVKSVLSQPLTAKARTSIYSFTLTESSLAIASGNRDERVCDGETELSSFSRTHLPVHGEHISFFAYRCRNSSMKFPFIFGNAIQKTAFDI